MNKPIVRFDSNGPSGNIFDILGRCSIVMKKEKRVCEYKAMSERVFLSNSYAAALAEIRKDIDLIDLSEEK